MVVLPQLGLLSSKCRSGAERTAGKALSPFCASSKRQVPVGIRYCQASAPDHVDIWRQYKKRIGKNDQITQGQM